MMGNPNDNGFFIPNEELHRPGQETSRAALEASTTSRESKAAQVHRWIKRKGYDGAIPEDFNAMDLIDVRRCFSVLKKLDKIEFTGEERKNDKGHFCQVWRAKA